MKNYLNILAILAISILFAGTALAEHSSAAIVSPNIVQPSTYYDFTANVENLVLPDPTDSITEFRIYINSEFSGFTCNPKAGWNGPFIIPFGNPPQYFCQYTVMTSDDEIAPGENTDFSFSATTPQTQSCRQIHLETRDPENFYRPFFIDVCVDTTPPVTTKTYDGAFYSDGTREWITPQTQVVMAAEDPQPHPSGVDETFYRVTQIDDYYCENPQQACAPLPPCNGDRSDQECSDEQFSTYSEPFKLGESCHIIEFYSIDNVGNREETKTQCPFVDDSPPVIRKTVGDPKVECKTTELGEVCDYFITRDTPITFSCIDQQPHPVNNNTIFWKYRVNEGEGYGAWSQTFEFEGNETSFTFPENSRHELQYWCEDALGHSTDTYTEFDYVDSEPPILSKVLVGDHQVGDCPPESEADECFIDDTVQIQLSVEDTEANHAVNNAWCEYSVEWEGQIIDDGTFYEYDEDATTLIFDQDSEHTLSVTCYDLLGNSVEDVETFNVDLEPPITTKTYGNPYYSCVEMCENLVDSQDCQVVLPNGEINANCIATCLNDEEFAQVCGGVDYLGHSYPQWITSDTPINLNAWDEKVGVETTHYRVSMAPSDEYCEVAETCRPCSVDAQSGETDCGEWQEVPGNDANFMIEDQSCHIIEYYAADFLENVEQTKYQCVFVDNTPPVVTKTVGDPKVEVCIEDGLASLESGNDPYPEVGTEIDEMLFPEGGGTGVGVAFDGEFLYYTYISSSNLYKIRPDGTGHAVIPTSGLSVPGLTTGVNGLGALSYDATRDKLWTGTYGCDAQNGGPVFLIDPVTGAAEYKFSVPSTYIRYCLDDGIAFDAGPTDSTDDDSVWYSDDVSPTLVHMGVDGNFLDAVNVCAIDSRLCHTSGVAIGGDNFYLGTNGSEVTLRVHRDTFTILDEFVNTNFRIEDMECDPETYAPVEVMWIRDAYGGNAKAYAIEPATCGLGGEPPSACEGETVTYITQQTPIELSCEDAMPHPIGNETIWWQYTLDGGAPIGPFEYEGPIYFHEDSVHMLEYWCVDGLGNESGHFFEEDRVDSTPPEIIKTVDGPQLGYCPPQPYPGEWEGGDMSSSVSEECFINDETTITVDTVDGGEICHVDEVSCEWGYLWNNEWFGLYPYTGPISFTQDSRHNLFLRCEDGLGNTVSEYENFNVDLTPPVTEKEYQGPYYSEQCNGSSVEACDPEASAGLFPEWINSDTNILLSAQDNKVGVDTTYISIRPVPNEFCENPQQNCNLDGNSDIIPGYFTPYEGPVSGIQESCHLIEFFSTDLLGNEELVNWQCTFVDNTPPVGIKTVGEPSTECSESDPECISPWDDEIVADFKITKFTPITLSCEDGQPHPVDHATVHWRWQLDNGPWSDWQWDEGPVLVMFQEESFHGLEFYCEDALGNTGETDLEYFKVSGTAFEVPLHWKWNLVSVPFVLDNDEPTEVFAGLEEEVESVWTYDGQTGQWYVFRPGMPETSNLESITPGWGYWVWANEDATLLIGGALFGENILPPSRELVEGWNLVGYYGVDWQDYGGDLRGGQDPALCEGDDPFFGSDTYCALNTLVNTNSGIPNWRSLLGYRNCGNHTPFWYGLGLCTEPDEPEPSEAAQMYAGKGYWISLDEDQIYAPAFVCNNPEKLVCD